MKNLITTLLFVLLLVTKIFAQENITTKDARKFKGQLVWVWDSVKTIRIISPIRVYMTLGTGVSDSCVTVILEGKGAVKNAKSLKPYMPEIKGRIEIIGDKPFITVTDFKRIKVPYCNCGEKGDPNILTFEPLPLTAGQQDTLNTALSNRNKADAPGIQLKDVKNYVGHIVYIRDSIMNFHQYSKSFTELYLGAKQPDQVVTILLADESLINEKAAWRKKGIGCFYGEVTLFNDKPAVIITTKDQITIEAQK
jgi:hypothetical protein